MSGAPAELIGGTSSQGIKIVGIPLHRGAALLPNRGVGYSEQPDFGDYCRKIQYVSY